MTLVCFSVINVNIIVENMKKEKKRDSKKVSDPRGIMTSQTHNMIAPGNNLVKPGISP